MKKIFWGLFFIVAAIFVIVNQLSDYTYIDLFSLLCTIFLIPILVTSILKINFSGILFSLAFLSIVYSEPLHLESITPWPVLIAALFGSVGFTIIFGKQKFYQKKNKDGFEQIINGEDSDEVNLNINFGSSIKYVNSDDFKIANLKCSFGSMKVYFDNTEIKGDRANINLDISFSGVELYIPKEWKIVNNVDVSLGGIEQKNISGANFEKTIILTGKVSLSGVEIICV